jgi:hypothetical protein
VVAPKYKKLYRPHKDTCGDEFVTALDGFLKPDGEDVDPGRLAKLKKDNGIEPAKWLDKNIGMQRMNVGNVLRARYKRGEEIYIGGQTLKGKAKAA